PFAQPLPQEENGRLAPLAAVAEADVQRVAPWAGPCQADEPVAVAEEEACPPKSPEADLAEVPAHPDLGGEVSLHHPQQPRGIRPAVGRFQVAPLAGDGDGQRLALAVEAAAAERVEGPVPAGEPGPRRRSGGGEGGGEDAGQKDSEAVHGSL